MHFHFRYDTMSEAEFGISCSIILYQLVVVVGSSGSGCYLRVGF